MKKRINVKEHLVNKEASMMTMKQWKQRTTDGSIDVVNSKDSEIVRGARCACARQSMASSINIARTDIIMYFSPHQIKVHTISHGSSSQ